MKYYETTFEEYVYSVQKYNFHPELTHYQKHLPKQIQDFPNTIFYGPSGVGKYSQMLNLLYPYSPSNFKYDKKVTIGNDKPEKKSKSTTSSSSSKSVAVSKKPDYLYRISDIHYEIDMSMLGCNPKSLWHEIFFQIVDIVSVKPNKTGIIVCKNFHMIYNELLDVFNSYVRHPFYNIHIKFVLLTEQTSFIPESLIKNFMMIPVKRPTVENHINVMKHQNRSFYGNMNGFGFTNGEKKRLTSNLQAIQCNSIINLKELHIIKKTDIENFPEDVFNIITDAILSKMLSPETIKIQEFRNDLYDLLIYNIEITDALYYILSFLLENKVLNEKSVRLILQECFTFLKHYNNNYRPIYHLENIIFFIIDKIHFNRTLE